jgi:glycosyltransferase involved in cell wall biosynthesis
MLTVLNVAYPLAPVRDDSVGGAEQVLAALDRALVMRGHRSVVVAHASSRVRGELTGIRVSSDRLDDQTRAQAIADTRRAIRERLAAGAVDLVHLHGVDCFEYLPDSSIPILATLHLPLTGYPRAAFASHPHVGRICVSRSQRQAVRALDLSPADEDRFAVVNNGVPLDVYRPAGRPGDFAFALGRICPDKGFDAAIRAARRAGMRLALAGATFAHQAHQRYFREVVVPLLDEHRRFIGQVGGVFKRRLLARARCVLIPSRVDETSSLVAMEALASGTPVIAFRRGALPDIVEHGRTGFIVDTEEEMADAIAAAGELRRADCRAAAEARFSADEMIRRYFALYALAAERGRAPRFADRP